MWREKHSTFHHPFSLPPSLISIPSSQCRSSLARTSLAQQNVWTLYDSSQLTSLSFHGPHSHFVISHPWRLFAYKGGRRRPMGMQRRDISGSRGLKGARVKRRTHTVPFLHHSHFAGRGRPDPRVHDSSSVHPRQDCSVQQVKTVKRPVPTNRNRQRPLSVAHSLSLSHACLVLLRLNLFLSSPHTNTSKFFLFLFFFFFPIALI